MKISVILTSVKEGGYAVTVPHVPGCFSYGKTKEEAMSNARQAIALYLKPTVSNVLQINPRSFKQIVLFTFSPNLGDTIVHEYGIISYLHEVNPSALILVVSPTSFFLRESNWLKPVQLNLSQFGAMENISTEVEKALGTHLNQDTLVLFNHGSLASLKRDDLIESFDAGTVLADRAAQNEITHHLMRKIHTSGAHGVGIFETLDQATDASNEYVVTENTWRLYLGSDAFLAWDPAHYCDLSASQKEGVEFLKSNFKNSNLPYLILNLNARGTLKVGDLKVDYASRLTELLETFHSRYLNLNILISRPESHYGEKALKEVGEVIRKYASAGDGRFTTLPEDKELWKPLLAGARAVITQDSGFTHVANIFNRQVLTMSRALTEESSTQGAKWWRKPDQTYVSFGRVNPTQLHHAPEVFTWLDRLLSQEQI
jgi:predicted RNase H-like HicB family nuclease